MARVNLDEFASDAFFKLPKNVQQLGARALWMIDWGPGYKSNVDIWKRAKYETIQGLLRECQTLAPGKPNGDDWLLWLYWKIIDNKDALDRRWPWPVGQSESGRVITRTIYGRLFASVTVWRINQALRAIGKQNHTLAVDEIAFAGLALNYAGHADATEEERLTQSFRHQKGAVARWAGDPSQLTKQRILEEWVRWQNDRSLYKYPRDFRRAMQLKFPEAVDGTLKNWMSEWTQTRSRHDPSRMSPCE